MLVDVRLGGQACGVDNEMEILANTGCYADFTLPSAAKQIHGKGCIRFRIVLNLRSRQPQNHRAARDQQFYFLGTNRAAVAGAVGKVRNPKALIDRQSVVNEKVTQ